MKTDRFCVKRQKNRSEWLKWENGNGKINFTNEDLISNIKAVINTIKEAKPEAVKGKFVKSIYLSTTMGPSVAVKLENLL